MFLKNDFTQDIFDGLKKREVKYKSKHTDNFPGVFITLQERRKIPRERSKEYKNFLVSISCIKS